MLDPDDSDIESIMSELYIALYLQHFEEVQPHVQAKGKVLSKAQQESKMACNIMHDSE